ncbi:MAG: hypothetical protein ABEJ77_05915 [Halanaeroarchaeum sp.]
MSEVLGYVLVFSLVVATVGVVYTTGLGGLQDAAETASVTNAERALIFLDDDLEALVTGEASTRATEIDVTNGAIGFGPPVTVTVTGGPAASVTARLTPIVYRPDRASGAVVAANGAVFRQRGGAAVPIEDPTTTIGPTSVVTIVRTRTRDDGIANGGRVLVRTAVTTRSVYHLQTNGTATISITSPRAEAWAAVLSDATGTDCVATGGTATCTVSTAEVYVQVVTIRTTLSA